MTGAVMGAATDFLTTGANAIFVGNNIRSAAVVNGTLVMAGTAGTGTGQPTTGGTRVAAGFVAGTTPSSSLYSGAVTNTREAQVWGSNVYWSSASGVASIFTSPLASAAGTDIISATNKPAGMSPYDFMFINGGATLYVADDSTANGGILKFTQNISGTYDFAYRMALPTSGGFLATTTGARGIGFAAGTIYATTSQTTDIANQVVSSAATNERYRGLEVVPEPASFAILGLGIASLVARKRRQ